MDDVGKTDFSGDIRIPEFRMVHMGAGQVGQQHAEGNADQKQRLKFLHQTKIKQHTGQHDHDDLAEVREQHEETGCLSEPSQCFQNTHRPLLK